MKKRLSCAALSAAAAAVIVTGCLWAADEPEADAPEEEQIVLHVMHNKQEAPETYHKLAEAFHQKYPDITVEYEVPTDFDLELQKRMNRGETPDIYTASPVQANAGLLLDLSGQEFLARMRPVHYDTVTRPGEYFFPMGYSGAGIICNETVLARYGLELPRTLSDLEDIHDTLSRNNVYTFALGFKDLWTAHYCFRPAYYAVYAGQPDWNSLRYEDKVSFSDTPGWKTVGDVVKDYVYAYGNTDTAFERGYMDACNMLAQNRAALLVQGSWAAAIIEDYNSNTTLRMVPLPVSDDPDENVINFYCDYSLSVSADTEHPKEALLYLDFLASEEAAEIYVENTGSFSGLLGAPMPDSSIAQDIMAYVDAGKYIGNPSDGWPPYFYTDAERILAEYMFGGRDYEEMTEALDSAWELRSEDL